MGFTIIWISGFIVTLICGGPTIKYLCNKVYRENGQYPSKLEQIITVFAAWPLIMLCAVNQK